jgi:hypothetical protein
VSVGRTQQPVISPGGGLQIEGRPLNITGAYSSPFDISVVAGQSSGAIMSFRYPGTGVAVLTRFDIQFATTGAFGTPQRILFVINRYTNWTADDTNSTGGLFQTVKRGTYSASAAVTKFVNNAILVQGTSTSVGNIATVAVYASGVGLNTGLMNVLGMGVGEHPIFFSQNEGFRLLLSSAIAGTTGTMIVTGTFHYFEAPNW